MRVTRAKQYRRHLRFFRIVYGISAPYKASFERENQGLNPINTSVHRVRTAVTKPPADWLSRQYLVPGTY